MEHGDIELLVSDLSVFQFYGLVVFAFWQVVITLLAIKHCPKLEMKQVPIFFGGMIALIGLPVYFAFTALEILPAP
jgi:hypothetical protein